MPFESGCNQSSLKSTRNTHTLKEAPPQPKVATMETTEKVKSRWARSFFTALDQRQNEEKYTCDTCHKDFTTPSALTLHKSTHVIERRFRCEPCQVSFHSPNHLQKHLRSSAHESRVEMTQAFGVPTSNNPRPYGCSECGTAFRKHGHLAKHLRSKSHITKLETNGLIPVGTYAALESSGNIELREKMVTTNCEQSIQSLRLISISLGREQEGEGVEEEEEEEEEVMEEEQQHAVPLLVPSRLAAENQRMKQESDG